MRATQHNGRRNSQGTFRARHNDRQFDANKAEHINADKTQDNKVIKMYDRSNTRKETLEEYEIAMYRKFFSKSQKAKNERYKKQGHRERCKTIKDLYKSKRCAPEEVILQIGKMGESVTGADVEKAIKKYCRDFHKKYGKNILILDWSLHLDESVPHVHLRRVYVSHDKDGNLVPNENKALKELGFEKPKQNKKEDRYNNRKISFSAEDRELFIDSIEATTQLTIVREPEKGKKRLKFEDYKLQCITQEVQQLAETERHLEVADYLLSEAPDVYDNILEDIDYDDNDIENSFTRQHNIEH